MKNHPSQRYCVLYITNQVMGVKGRYVPFFVYDSTNIKKIEKRVAKAIKKYGLTDMYLFHAYDQFSPKTYAVCLKSFQKRRLKKIAQNAHSSNLVELMKFGVSRLKFSGRMFMDKSYENDGPVFIKTVKSSDLVNARSFVSRGHSNFLRSYGIPLTKFPNQHGNDNVMVTKCWFTTEE